MTELDDHALLSAYAHTASEAAFAALVARYVNLVFSTARRFTGNPHHAEEVTQAVFIILARKAGSLRRGTVLSGWLYQTARLTAANFVKGEIRRQNREQETYMQSTLCEPEGAAWEQIEPLLDEAMGQLGEADRNAVLLRFFENKTAREVGATLKLNEAAAHKRVNRALEKLRKFFTKRGVALSGTLIAGAVAGNSVQAAPAGLAATVTAAAAKGTTAAASIAALVKGTTKVMAWGKIKLAVGTGAAALLGSGAVVVLVLASANPPSKNPAVARQIIQGIFSHISNPLPAQMRFVAEIEEVQKPWTEAHILAAVKKQEDELHKRYETIPGLRDADWAKASPAAQEQRRRGQAESRQINMEMTRRAHGTRTHVDQEWLSGGLWRLDQLETTPKPERLQAADRPLPAGMTYEETMINISDTNTNKRPPSNIDYRNRSALFGSIGWEKPAFWEAATLEPHFGFLMTMIASDFADIMQLSQTKPKWEQDIDSFAGMKLDTNKLEDLAMGKDGRWSVQTDEAVLNGRKMAVLRLKGKTISLAHGEEIAFFADASHLTNIYRIELTKTELPLLKTPYISIRDDFDANGFPHTWIVETPTAETLKKTVKFKEVDFHAKFDDKAVFFPPIPADYSVNGRAPQR